MTSELFVETHPLDHLLRADRLPHIFCPGCGLGAITEAYTKIGRASCRERV